MYIQVQNWPKFFCEHNFTCISWILESSDTSSWQKRALGDGEFCILLHILQTQSASHTRYLSRSPQESHLSLWRHSAHGGFVSLVVLPRHSTWATPVSKGWGTRTAALEVAMARGLWSLSMRREADPSEKQELSQRHGQQPHRTLMVSNLRSPQVL